LRLKTLKLAFASLGVCLLADAALVKELIIVSEPVNESIGASLNHRPVPPFAMNAILAKFDRAKARGRAAIRLGVLAPINSAPDVRPRPVGLEPFGLSTTPAPEDALWRKWRGVESDMMAEEAIMERCRANVEVCPPNVAQFLRLIDTVKSKSGRTALDEANRAVNASLRYMSDQLQFGEADRWTTPLASFATAVGDCEDYAIAKYVALREAGFPRDDLQLVLVRDRAAWQDHAVLLARIDEHWLILDNRHSELLEDIDAVTLTPLYAINHRGVRLFATPDVNEATRDFDAGPQILAGAD
jgi:predicted transglutaminase-like cysteine proteinase